MDNVEIGSLSEDLDEPLSICWGAIAKGDEGGCTPGFEAGRNHFKNKFCGKCRDQGLELPAWRVRALTDEMKILYSTNVTSMGFWKSAPHSLGGGEFRLFNNTRLCEGPWLVLFRESPPRLQWEPMPAAWEEDGAIRVAVSKGTLVPVPALTHSKTRRLNMSNTMSVEGARKRRVESGGTDVPPADVPLPAPLPSALLPTSAALLPPAFLPAPPLLVPSAGLLASSFGSVDLWAPRALSGSSTPPEGYSPPHDEFWDGPSSDSFSWPPGSSNASTPPEHATPPLLATPRHSSFTGEADCRAASELLHQMLALRPMQEGGASAVDVTSLLRQLHSAVTAARDASAKLLASTDALPEAHAVLVREMAQRWKADAAMVGMMAEARPVRKADPIPQMMAEAIPHRVADAPPSSRPLTASSQPMVVDPDSLYLPREIPHDLSRSGLPVPPLGAMAPPLGAMAPPLGAMAPPGGVLIPCGPSCGSARPLAPVALGPTAASGMLGSSREIAPPAAFCPMSAVSPVSSGAHGLLPQQGPGPSTGLSAGFAFANKPYHHAAAAPFHSACGAFHAPVGPVASAPPMPEMPTSAVAVASAVDAPPSPHKIPRGAPPSRDEREQATRATMPSMPAVPTMSPVPTAPTTPPPVPPEVPTNMLPTMPPSAAGWHRRLTPQAIPTAAAQSDLAEVADEVASWFAADGMPAANHEAPMFPQVAPPQSAP